MLPRRPQELGYPQLDPKFRDKEPVTQLAQRPLLFVSVAARADDLVSLWHIAEVAKKTTSVGQAKPVTLEIFPVFSCDSVTVQLSSSQCFRDLLWQYRSAAQSKSQSRSERSGVLVPCCTEALQQGSQDANKGSKGMQCTYVLDMIPHFFLVILVLH